MSRVLITGATGFVGGHILGQLYLRGYKIRATYRSANFDELALICKALQIDFDKLHSSVEWIKLDLLDKVALDRAMWDIDEVYHCAAMVNFDSDKANTLKDNNIGITQNIVDTCLRKRINKLCYISSIGALGGHRPTDGKIDEYCFADNEQTSSVYSNSKQLAEKVVWQAIKESLETIILNPGIILGPGSLDKGGNLLIKKIHRGMFCYTRGATGYVDVRDVAGIALYCMEHNITNRRLVCVSENLSYKELFKTILQVLNKRRPLVKIHKPLLYVAYAGVMLSNLFKKKKSPFTKATLLTSLKQHVYDNTRIRQTVDYKFTPIRQTIEDTIKLS